MSAAAGASPSGYVPRREEAAIREQVDKVRADGRGRAVLLYGSGGVGKTTLVQTLAGTGGSGDVVWVPPIDVDDSEYWLLSNLETTVAQAVDPEGRHFGPYYDYLRRLPRYSHGVSGYESVLSHLGRINRTFIECYRSFVRTSGRTVVVTLDTVEAVRSMYLLLTLTQWMKELPATLFVLAGRPLSRREHQDPIREELRDPHRPLEFAEIDLQGFDETEAHAFLDRSPIGASLSEAERGQLIELTAGQPLWLALAVEYLLVSDPPEEMLVPIRDQQRPHERFRRRLVTLYRSTGFWAEAIKRLSVVRHSVNQEVWERLMADRELPPEAADWDEAWQLLLRRPWVRPRANRRYVTLHDALAEELAQRLIPLHDQDEAWRRDLWHRATQIYDELTAGSEESIGSELDELTTALRASDGHEQDQLIQEVGKLDARKRELDQLLTAQLHYQILDDFAAGTERFLQLCDQAAKRRDPLFMELICHEVERFVPHGATGEPLEDVLDVVLARFQDWLRTEAPERYIEIVLRIAGFLIGNEQPEPALELLEDLPEEQHVGPRLRYRLANERGNACMRIAGRVEEAEDHFRWALTQARTFSGAEAVFGEAEAQKELGFYYRNLGRWHDADDAYRTARDVLSRIMGPGSSRRDRGEMASIQTNWAYLKALRGDYRQARNLVDSAIAIRRRFGQRQGEAISLSVSGEVYRYDGKFARAWRAYQAAEEIFHELKNWPWLGLIYQEQAICLFQGSRENFVITERQGELARELIQRSLDICRESAIRYYPSALNRAGRIFGDTDPDTGIAHLDEAIDEARRIGDGWFYSANLIEYLELNFRAWRETGRRAYRDAITRRVHDVTAAIDTYRFADLYGRWELLQGHLLVHDVLAGDTDQDLDDAIDHYSVGFRWLADERVGSHGSAAIAGEFEKFRELFDRLPEPVQIQWYERLLGDWSAPDHAERSTSLLARLEELY